MLPLLA
jgi:FAD:protein FMN transferase